MLSSANNFMWQMQQFLHKKPEAVPGTLLTLAGCLLIHRHSTHEEVYGADQIKLFLGMIIVQMLPLVALELKIMACADPVGLFCKFATPVTLVHAIFLTMRLCMWRLYDTSYLVCSALGLAAALLTLSKGFKATPLSIIKCTDVWFLVFFAFAAAFATNSLDHYINPPATWMVPSPEVREALESGQLVRDEQIWSTFFNEMLGTSNSYMELLGFVPAVWMVYRQDQRVYDDTDGVSTKRKATAFFFFLITFYFMEDVLQAWDAYSMTKVGALAHLLHFVLICDFAFFVLAHVYNTDKLVGQLRKWLPADLAYDV